MLKSVVFLCARDSKDSLEVAIEDNQSVSLTADYDGDTDGEARTIFLSTRDVGEVIELLRKAQSMVEKKDSVGIGDLNLDVSADEARALHRVVRAIHDGNCPACGHLAPSEEFWIGAAKMHQCPRCEFSVTEDEAQEAMAAFRPFMEKAVEVFNSWRTSDPPVIGPSTE